MEQSTYSGHCRQVVLTQISRCVSVTEVAHGVVYM